jgi:hypothetical protein
MTRPLYEAGSQNKSKMKRKEYSAYGMHHVARTFDENFQGKGKEQQKCAKSSKKPIVRRDGENSEGTVN